MPETKIIIQTRKGNDLDNFQNNEISTSEYRIFEEQLLRFPAARKRSKIEPHYNCYGMVFGSRRTGIPDSEIGKIIAEDGYKEIQLVNVEPGDVILFLTNEGDYVHAGIVLEKPTIENLNMPLIYSKWGRANEFIHTPINSPYDTSNLKYYRIISEYEE